MSSCNEQPVFRQLDALEGTQDQDQPFVSEGTRVVIESMQPVNRDDNIVTENCGSSSDESDDDEADELSWLAKVFDPTIQKVEDWEENWDTESESE